MWSELWGVVADAWEACSTLLPPPPPEGSNDLTGWLCSLLALVLRVIRCAIYQGTTAALTLMRLQVPPVNLCARHPRLQL